jgi:alpha-2-macroglobulin
MPADDGWWPAYTAWQTFAVKVLAEGGRNADAHVTRLYSRLDRMPVFAMAYLLDALVAKSETGRRVEELQRRLTNAILPEGGSAHVEELNDPYLLWFWNSNVTSTSIALRSLMRSSAADHLVRPMVRWLLSVRTKGRWGNTQDNARAMEALVAYYRKYESDVPAFRAAVRLGGDDLVRAQFEGRSAEAAVHDLPMPELSAKMAPGSTREITFSRQGTGTLFYVARLRYAADALYQQGHDNGMRVERRYEPYRETPAAAQAPSLRYTAGDLVKVTLSFTLPKERRFVAVTDPLPAGFEPVESWFATTAMNLTRAQDTLETQGDWRSWWMRGGFDHVERHDDRVQLFATRLDEGRHEFSYIVRATTAGTFRTAPAHAEEMYAPEVFGRTETAIVEVQP